jgi:hypothetical protein
MDDRRFDELVAKLGTAPSRRDAIKGLIAGAVAATGLAPDAEAKPGKGKKGGAGVEHGKCKNSAQCERTHGGPQWRCCRGGQAGPKHKHCVNTNAHRRHCGDCNNKCPATDICRKGNCIPVS